VEPELVEYLIREHNRLLPRLETLALKHLLHNQKLDAADGELRAKRKALMLRAGWLTDSDEALSLLSDGDAAFRQRLAQWIYNEHGGEALLNNCPRCHRLARTAKAKQCRYCGYGWH
jgi:hypothetical protein